MWTLIMGNVPCSAYAEIFKLTKKCYPQKTNFLFMRHTVIETHH